MQTRVQEILNKRDAHPKPKTRRSQFGRRRSNAPGATARALVAHEHKCNAGAAAVAITVQPTKQSPRNQQKNDMQQATRANRSQMHGESGRCLQRLPRLEMKLPLPLLLAPVYTIEYSDENFRIFSKKWFKFIFHKTPTEPNFSNVLDALH
jgi:hypothetical protein